MSYDHQSPSDRSDMEPDYYHGLEDDECQNCGGEGFVSSCVEEFSCLHPEDGCDYCTRRCDWCNAPKKSGGSA